MATPSNGTGPMDHSPGRVTSAQAFPSSHRSEHHCAPTVQVIAAPEKGNATAMTCQTHRTYTSRGCAACQRGHTQRTTSSSHSTSNLAQDTLTQSTTATAFQPASQPVSCDTSTPSAPSDPGCSPS